MIFEKIAIDTWRAARVGSLRERDSLGIIFNQESFSVIEYQSRTVLGNILARFSLLLSDKDC